jgi:proteasome lid subunit RPN8/RPN11
MTPETKEAIAAHAIAEYPRECCGFLVDVDGQEVYFPCRNVADKPEEFFAISAADYADCEDVGEIRAVVHSHPGASARPSAADRAVCERSDIDLWIICSLGIQDDGSIGIDDWCEFGKTGFLAPLIGRQFVHGVHDCYAIIRDWYQIERGIKLPDFERSDKWWEDGHSSLYLDNYKKAGFVDVGRNAQLEPGDVLLMQIRSKNGVPNHAGIYTGEGRFIHHMHSRLSVRALFGGMWRDCLITVLRYEG